MQSVLFLTPDEVTERYRNEISAGALRNWRAMRVLHQGGRRKVEVVLNFRERLALRLTVQPVAPSGHPISAAGSGSSP